MKKEDLVALGLSEEQIAEMQKLNGKDIAKEQEKIARIEAERGNYKSQLDTAHEALKKFEGIDVDKLQGEIQKLQKDLQDAETKHQAELADRDFNALLDSQINALGERTLRR